MLKAYCTIPLLCICRRIHVWPLCSAPVWPAIALRRIVVLTTHDKAKQNLYWKECFSGSYQITCSFSSKQMNLQQYELNMVVDPELLTAKLLTYSLLLILLNLNVLSPPFTCLTCLPSCFWVPLCQALSCVYQPTLSPASAGSRPNLW